MEKLRLTIIFLMMSIPWSAFAACTGTPLDAATLTTLIDGKTVCGRSGTDTWQEEHRVGGDLYDYKKGPNDPIDPEEKVGTWNISSGMGHGAGAVTYTYSGGDSFSYLVYDNGGGAYSFCGAGGVIVDATVKSSPPC